MRATYGAIALAFLGACTTAGSYRSPYSAAPYHAAQSVADVGYFDTRIDQNRFIVQYRPGWSGDARGAETFALMRASELALARGYDWFQVLSRNGVAYPYGHDAYRAGSYDYGRYRDYPSLYDDDAVSIEVFMGANPPPRSPAVYDARAVLNHVAPRERW